MTDLSSFIATNILPRRKPRTTPTPAIKFVGSNDGLLADLANALGHISPESYFDWANCLMRLKTLGEPGRELARQWSERSAKHTDDEFHAKWNALNPDRTGHAAIFAEAQRNGWKNPGYSLNLPPVDTSALFQTASRFHLLSGADLEAQPPMEWRIKGILPVQGVAVIYGPSGAGKSFLALDQACAIAEGREWFGRRVKAAPVLYLGLEGQAGFRSRAMAWKMRHGRDIPNGVRFILDPFELNNLDYVNELAALCQPQPGVVIYIDTLNRAAAGADENTSEGMGALISGASALQRQTGGVVVIISHTGKDHSKGVRGHSSLIAALDASIFVNKSGERRLWTAEKVKDGEDGKDHHFRLAVIPIGTDEDGDPITSCIIAPEHGTFESSPSKPLTASHVLGMTAFRTAAETFGRLDENKAFVGLHADQWRLEYYRISTADNAEAKRKAFQRVRSELVQNGHVTVDNDLYSLSGANAAIDNAFIAAQIDSGTTGQGPDMGGTCPAS